LQNQSQMQNVCHNVYGTIKYVMKLNFI